MKIFEITAPALPANPLDALAFIKKTQRELGMTSPTGNALDAGFYGDSSSDTDKKTSSDTGNTTTDKIDNKTASGTAPSAPMDLSKVKDGGPIPLSALPKSNPTRVDPKVMASYLKYKGLRAEHIGGLLVSVKWECGFKPGVWIGSDNKQGPSGGLFGFHNVKHDGTGLFTNMIWACGGLDKWQTNWQGQFDFALSGAVGQKYLATKFKSAGDAAHWWVINYEKPADTQGQAVARAREAERYALA